MSVEGGRGIVKDGLVLYLDAANKKSYSVSDSSWIDLSRNGNNGTLTNGPTFSSLNSGIIVFNGSNLVTFPNIPDFYFLNRSQYTLSIFAKIISSDYIFSGLINREYGGSPRNGYNFWFYRDSASQVAIASERWAGTGQKVAFVLLDNSLCINVWNHYCVTYDGTNLRFYLNGQISNTAFADGNITNTTGTLQIAKRNTDFANVAISNVQIYNRALSASEVLQNYNSSKSRFTL